MSPYDKSALAMFAISTNTSDYGTRFVVREHRVSGGHTHTALVPHAVCDSLEEARASIPDGLVCLDRNEDDDPVIVEVWL